MRRVNQLSHVGPAYRVTRPAHVVGGKGSVVVEQTFLGAGLLRVGKRVGAEKRQHGVLAAWVEQERLGVQARQPRGSVGDP